MLRLRNALFFDIICATALIKSLTLFVWPLFIGAMAALQTLMWLFQSRIYENGRPNVQECVLNGLFAVLYLFAAAWQFYYIFAQQSPSEFLCSTDGFDMELHCRLWQSQVVGCAACGALFLLVTLVWVWLFRQRPMVLKDLAEDYITSSPTLTSARAKEDANRREKEEAEAIAAEAERRRVLHRQQQQQMQQQHQVRQIPQSRPTNAYQNQNQGQYPQQQQNHMVQHQGSSNYLNQGRQQTYVRRSKDIRLHVFCFLQLTANTCHFFIRFHSHSYSNSHSNRLESFLRHQVPMLLRAMMEPTIMNTTPAADNSNNNNSTHTRLLPTQPRDTTTDRTQI